MDRFLTLWLENELPGTSNGNLLPINPPGLDFVTCKQRIPRHNNQTTDSTEERYVSSQAQMSVLQLHLLHST